jgi:hypothetical protein
MKLEMDPLDLSVSLTLQSLNKVLVALLSSFSSLDCLSPAMGVLLSLFSCKRDKSLRGLRIPTGATRRQSELIVGPNGIFENVLRPVDLK